MKKFSSSLPKYSSIRKRRFSKIQCSQSLVHFRADAYNFVLRNIRCPTVPLSLSLFFEITPLNRRSQDHVRASSGHPIGFRREYLAAISHHYSHALQDGVWFSVVAGRWFAVRRPKRGFHIGYRRRGGGAYISSVCGFSKIDERAGMPPRAKTRCIQVPHLVFMVARAAGRDRGRAVDRGVKKKKMEKSSIARVGKNPHCADTMRHAHHSQMNHSSRSFFVTSCRKARECTSFKENVRRADCMSNITLVRCIFTGQNFALENCSCIL